jgi:branched-chain amino acid aminotransferase
MDRTAKILGFNEILIDRATLRCVLRSILENLPFREARVRLTMDLTVDPGTVYVSTLQLKTPAQEDYEAGVKAVTYPLERNQPAAKVTEFIGSANKVRQDLPEGIHEALLVNPHGEILEGLSSNFFAIYKGEVWTAEEGVLPGVTRSIVMDITQRLGLQVRHQPVNAAWLGEIQGAFITSSSRGVLPIAQIDLIKIGNGSPGEITREIQSEYNRKIEEELETI